MVREKYEMEMIEGEDTASDGKEIAWASIKRDKKMDILVGVVYVTPQGLNKSKCKGESILSYVLEKNQQGLDVPIMGDFNAHFNDEGEPLDCRAKFVQRLCEVVGVRTMNFKAITKGKWTWQGGK